MFKFFKQLSTLILIVGFFQPINAKPKLSKNYYPLTKLTESGRLQLTIQAQVIPIPLNKLHHWTVKIKTPVNQSVQPREIIISGGMPRHSHGLPTMPVVTRYLGDGEYLIEGVQFHMDGVWQLHFKCLDKTGWDQVTFDVLIGSGKMENTEGWSDSEIAAIKSLWLGSNPTLPPDSSNALADNLEVAELGQKIFFDTSFSRNKQVSCATCHDPERNFTDGKEKSEGLTKVARNAPSLVGVAYNHWFYWDGRRDSLWAQALTPFESAQEMGFTRVGVLQVIAEQPDYRKAYTKLFGPLPKWLEQKRTVIKPASPIGNDDEKLAWKNIPLRDKRAINNSFANIGKAIAAYERKLLPAPAVFDQYVETLVNQGNEVAQSILSPQQLAGLKLFISGKTQCVTCHNGPLLTNQSFHNIGTGFNGEKFQDMGRLLGIQAVLIDEFNCLGPYSDAPQAACEKLKYINRQEIGGLMNGAFKVPSLRNLAYTAPYMHDGRFASLKEVLKYYQNPPDKTRSLHEISKLDLSLQDIENIAAFLKTLSGPLATSPRWLEASIN